MPTNLTKSMHVSSLHIYPVKSLGGISLERMPLYKRGPIFDREWMLVDDQGLFLSQREKSRMALIKCRLEDLAELGKIETAKTLCIDVPGYPTISVDIQTGANSEGADSDNANEVIEVKVWKDKCMARVEKVGAEILSDYLVQKVRLVRMLPDFDRSIDEDYIGKGKHADTVGFADGFPLLLISDASLDDLNSKLEIPVEMNRFRPNITVSGATPFAEDKWTDVKVAGRDVHMEIVKPCSRCQITTIDQDTADISKEPLRTLSTFRKQDGKVMFGQNAVLTPVKDGAAIYLQDELLT